MEKTDISHEFEKAVMNYFLDYVVFSTDGTAFESFVQTFRDETNADDEIIREELKNRINLRADKFFENK